MSQKVLRKPLRPLKPFETSQRIIKIKMSVNFYFNTTFWNAGGGKGYTKKCSIIVFEKVAACVGLSRNSGTIVKKIFGFVWKGSWMFPLPAVIDATYAIYVIYAIRFCWVIRKIVFFSDRVLCVESLSNC